MATFLSESKRSFIRASMLVALGIAILLVLAMQRGWLDWAENPSYDWRARQVASSGKSPLAEQIVIIDIDNASFDQLKPMFGRWPWSRRVWTEVVRYVAKGKPKVIGLDIILGGEESKEVDGEFARVMKDAGNVVIAFSFSPTEMQLEDDSEVRKKLESLTRHGSVMSTDETRGERVHLDSVSLNTPLELYLSAAKGIGSINTMPDRDGVIRRVPTIFTLDRTAYGSLATGMFVVAKDGRARFDPTPTNKAWHVILAWNNSLDNTRIPLWQVICSIYPDQCPEGVKTFPPEFFKDKIILLGASASASYDAHNFPIGEQKPGFLMQITALENMLRGRAVRTVSPWTAAVMVILLVAAGTASVIFISSASWSALVIALVAALYTFMSVWAMQWDLLWLPMAAPLLGLVASFGSASVIRYATTGRELRRTRGTLDRYVSPQLVNYVLEHIKDINLAGEKRELTILFSDVRSFTTMTEGTDPMELIRTLNEYLEQMTDIIYKYDGITDKFIGDGILAYWGAFTPGKNHAELGCRAALEMFERLDVLNEKFRSEGRKELAIGVGVNTGEVIFGNVGSGRKIEFTVIGDPVNLAARLESTTKDYGAKIIISEFTYERVKDLVEVRPLGGVKVKGKTVETQIFELKSMSPKGSADAAVN